MSEAEMLFYEFFVKISARFFESGMLVTTLLLLAFGVLCTFAESVSLYFKRNKDRKNLYKRLERLEKLVLDNGAAEEVPGHEDREVAQDG